MGHRSRQSRGGGEIWALAQRQHYVVTRAQLLGLGLSREAIKHRIRTRRLHVIWRGVYAVGRPDLSRLGKLMAAVLACGPTAVLSHGTAAELWGIAGQSPVIHVSVRGGSDRKLPGIRTHRRRTLDEEHVMEHHGVPVTTPICTLIDIASSLSATELETAINEGNKRDLFDPDELSDAVDTYPGRAGVAALRKILRRHAFTLTDSQLERRFLPIAARAGLPPPQTQAWVNGFRVDFYWEIGLVVETDGLRYHRTAAQQARDRLRDQAHTAAGLTALRFTHAQVRFEPEHVQTVLATVYARLLR